MKQKVTVYFKDKTKCPMILHNVDDASFEYDGKILSILKKDEFQYAIPVENVNYVICESDGDNDSKSSPIITPEEFKINMEKISKSHTITRDEEEIHVEMDDLMCDVLNTLGYNEGVDIFVNTDKWYA